MSCLPMERKIFWDSIEPSIEGMLQTENAEILGNVDTMEILRYLPCYRGKRILDLGAGIGRFTKRFAETAQHVTAVDISEQFISQNRENNRQSSNITFITSDVMRLDFPADSFDLIFSSWLLKYLSEDEITQFLQRILTWLTTESHFFFRESCFYDIGTISREDNPTTFRTLLNYYELLHSITSNGAHFKLLKCKNAQSYIQGAPNQICFLAKSMNIHEEMDICVLMNSRFSLQNINMMEKLYGTPWVNVGQEDIAEELYSRLQLHPSQRVLEIGCGTGSSAIFIAHSYRANVYGIDISVAAINIALEKQLKLNKDLRKKLQFEVGDIQNMEFDECYFDVVYSRECLMYISNKHLLFKKIKHWLRPGGTLLFTDAIKGSCPPSNEFLEYLNTIKPCTLDTLDSYKKLMQSEFQEVVPLDFGERWIEILQNDLKLCASTYASFGNVTFHNKMCEISRNKIEWIKGKQLSWGVFWATKRQMKDDAIVAC